MGKLKREPKRIIVRMPNWVGDLVMATPILTDLRHRFPEAEITAMALDRVAALLEHDRDIDELFVFSRPSGWVKKDERRNIARKLRRGKYDLGILLTNSLSSAFWFWRGNVKYRIGFRGDSRSWLLTQAIPRPHDREQNHLVKTYKELLLPLGIPPSETEPRIHLLDEEREEAEAMLRRLGVPEQRKLVGINPGAAYGSAKCWLPERFREVTERLIEDPEVYVAYFGDATGAPLVKRICAELPKRVINLAGATSLRQLAALIEACDVFLTNDSGPMHMASALGTPLVALFGSTSDVKTGPYRQGTVIHKHVECSPCYLRQCPIDFRCMTQITADEVYQALQEKLECMSVVT